MEIDVIYNEDCLEMKKLPNDSIDLVATDPPYGIKFMGKSWDKALPDIKVWHECLRVLKPGALAFVMCIPRQDCLARMIVSLEDAGFNVSFTSMYYCFASGFPKAQNIGKAVDKRLKEYDNAPIKEIKTDGTSPTGFQPSKGWHEHNMQQTYEVKERVSPQAQALDGSYGGFQPKPAVEVVIVAMKPLSEKTYVDQALANGKGVTWLDGGRIPYNGQRPKGSGKSGDSIYSQVKSSRGNNGNTTPSSGRFPANLLVSDDVLNDGRVSKSREGGFTSGRNFAENKSGFLNDRPRMGHSDSGSFSRYFSLDAWFAKKLEELPAGVRKTFPFLIVPKASKAEKNRGCEGLEEKSNQEYDGRKGQNNSEIRPDGSERKAIRAGNFHPTCKPIKLFSYLITLGSREDDVILDPFIGSGTTAIAARMLGRRYVGFEIDKDYCEIAKRRLAEVQLALI